MATMFSPSVRCSVHCDDRRGGAAGTAVWAAVRWCVALAALLILTSGVPAWGAAPAVPAAPTAPTGTVPLGEPAAPAAGAAPASPASDGGLTLPRPRAVAAASPARQARIAGQPMLPARIAAPSLPLMPYLDYLLDESGTLDIEEAAAPERADAYAPLALEALPRAEGVVWLRFTLAPLARDEKPATLLLDMGPSVPGTPMLYDPERNDLSGALEWRESSPAQRNVLLLPEAQSEAMTCYIRLDGVPGLWFAPTVRTPGDAATNWGSLARTGAMLALGVVMLLCLLRGVSENGQWRVWTALYVAVALAQALVGMPAADAGHLGFGHAAAVLLPGIALMLLPHVGRHLMRTAAQSRSIDIQLLLLSLPGAALALLPLLPGWAWLDRWLDLWPAGTLLFVPTALGAWIMGLGGSRRFLLGCLLPPLFVAAGVLGLDFGLPANLLSSAPLWGVALSALLIAATRAPEEGERAHPGQEKAPAQDEAGVITLDHPLDDSNLRLIPPSAVGSRAGMEPDMRADMPSDTGAEARPQGRPASPGLDQAAVAGAVAEAREQALRAPLDELMREGAALERCALPTAVRLHAEGMLMAARQMADVLSGPGAPADSGEEANGEDGGHAETVFDLQQILREAHDAVAPAAEYAGIGLAWYLPPHLPQLYRGDVTALGETLRLLLESAVRATQHGAVHLSARRVPESPNPGHLLFTVTDSGSGIPPRERSTLAFTRAWELAARHGGYVGLECGPEGTSIVFSLHFTPLENAEDDGQAVREPHVIIVGDSSEQRRELARMLADLPCRCSEAASEHEVLRRQAADPAVLLVAQGRYAVPARADMVGRFVSLAREAGLAICKVLAITPDDRQWTLLSDSGFTHALLEPVDAGGLRRAVLEFIQAARQSGRQTPEPGPADTETAADSAMHGQASAEDSDGRNERHAHEAEISPDDNGEVRGETAPPPAGASFPESSGEAPDTAGQTVAETPGAVADDRDTSGSAAALGPAPETVASATPAPEIAASEATSPESAPAESAPRKTASDAAEPESAVAGPDADARSGELSGEEVEFFLLTTQAGSGTGGAPAQGGAPAVTWAEKMAAARDSAPAPGSEPEAAPAAESGAGGAASDAAPAASDRDAGLTPEGYLRPDGRAEAAATPETMADAVTLIPENGGFAPEPRSDAESAAAQPSPVRPSPVEPSAGDAAAAVSASAEASEAEGVGTSPVSWSDSAEPPRAAPAAPEAAAARTGHSGQSSRAATAGSVYISPALENPGEWVGEPMPLGTPLSGGGARSAQRRDERPAGHQDMGEQRPQRPASRAVSDYTSPSVRVPGEWVGEPMPIPRKKTEPPQAADAGTPLADDDRASPAREPATPAMPGRAAAEEGATPTDVAEADPAGVSPAGGSFMDFIVGATPAEEPRERGAAPEKTHPLSGVTDFMETSVSLVTTAISSVFSAASPDETKPCAMTDNGVSSPQHPVADAEAGAARGHAEQDDTPAQADPVMDAQTDSPDLAMPDFFTPRGPDPAVVAAVSRVDVAMREANAAFAAGDCRAVTVAVGRIVSESRNFGLNMERTAGSAERAAIKCDMAALSDLLAELSLGVERKRIEMTRWK